MNDLRLSIVIPAYHEQATIGAVLADIAAHAPRPVEVLLVCDRHDDPTIAVAEAARGELSLHVLINEAGGALPAIRCGMAEARGRWVVVMTADGSDEAATLPHMLAAAETAGAAIAAASRYMPGGRALDAPRLQGTLSRLGNAALSRLVGVGTRDATNTFKLIERAFLAATPIESQGGFEWAIELVVKAREAGRAVVEVPTTWHGRAHGVSRFRLWSWLPRYVHWALRACFRR